MEKENYWMAACLVLIHISTAIFSLMLMFSGKSFILEWDILSLFGVTMLFNFYMDWMSITFFSFVALISSSVLFYSGSYMKGESSYRLFMFLVLMFVTSMFFMVFSLNLVSMMLGWDGLGVISYILVIYYKNSKSSSAGMITALSNRVGDAALLLSVACFLEVGSWNYMFMHFKNSNLLCWLIVLAALTKSAQIPFSAWLPAAMAAPTPVSALVHSSTLVTAGVYLLIRFNKLLSNSFEAEMLIYTGMLTTLMASMSALFEVDFKKVVALSTLSQLGIMVMTLSFGFVKLAYLHMLTHAVFKALLFMCSGKVIHMVSGFQDIRKMGGMFFNLPITSMLMNLSSLSLCGIPFLSGFYTKDLIMESILTQDTFIFNYSMYMLVVGLSASYSFRLVYFSMIHTSNQFKVSASSEKDWTMLSSKLGLMIMTMILGSWLIWLSLPTPAMISLIFSLKMLALWSMLGGFFFGLMLCFSNFKNKLLIMKLKSITSVMVLWHLPLLSGSIVGFMAKSTNQEMENSNLGWYEIFSGQGFNLLLLKGSEILMVWLMTGVKGTLVIFILSGLLYF